jgi:hypothetical protein
MFSYPSRPWILTRDNLVLGCTGSPTMPSVAGMRSGTEMTITTKYLVMRLDRLIELLQGYLGVTGDGGNVLAKGDDAGDLQSSGNDNAILPVAPSYL